MIGSARDPKRDTREIERFRDLTCGFPGEVLGRLVEGDPLGLEPLARKRVAVEAFFVDGRRLCMRTAARVAFESFFFDGAQGLRDWLTARVDQALADLVKDQEGEELQGLPVSQSPDATYYLAVAGGLELEPGLARLACLTLNHLSRDQRRAYRALAVEKKTLERWVGEGNGPRERAQELLREATMALLLVLDARRTEQEGGA